jgi:surface antigen
MRINGKTLRRSRAAVAAAGLAALISASACTPLATVTRASNGAGTSAAANVGPYDVHVATPHFAFAPAINAYPWANDESWAPDAYGLTRRQCVSYAAWYINSHGTPFGYYTKGPRGTAAFTDATTWDSAAYQAGFTVSTTPVVGSVAQWHAYESSSWTTPGRYYTFTAGGAGHVGIVTAVYPDGSVDVAQYNLGDNRSFSVMHMKAPRYIYIPLASPSVG